MMKARHLLLAALWCGMCALPAGAEERRFDIAVNEAPARAFFEGLADGTPYNLVFEPGITGNISLKLKNVTLIEALDAVRDAYGYDYRRMSTGFVIIPPVLQVRLYQINYLDVERRGTSHTNVTSGEVTPQNTQTAGLNGMASPMATNSNSLSEPPGGVFNKEGAAANGSDRIKEINGTSISTRSSSEFWRDLETSLHTLVGNAPGHTVVVNSQSGIIAVRATPRELHDVTDFLDKIQNVSTRQVVLEAKIVEVELSKGFQAGIDWAAIGRSGGRTISGFQTGPQNGFGSADLLKQPSQTIPIGPGNVITSTATNTLGGAFALAVNAADFNAYVELLSTQGKTRVLSSPRVSTLNNQKAVIKSGSDEFFVTGVSSDTVTGTATSTSRNVNLAPFFSGVALDVTPQIAADGQVILHIHPTVSQVTEKVEQLTSAGVTDSLPLAYSQVRESDSVVTARSGQLIVIGGLMSTTQTTSNYGIPGLGSLPLVGNLFRSQQKTDMHTELVILLRPVVIDRDEQWQGMSAEPTGGP
jgi:MSHA biogenesis protein MshL